MLTTPVQLRAARAMLGWTQDDLAKYSGVAISTIRRMEALATFTCTVPVMQKVQYSLEKAGIEFLNHGQPGVRLVVAFAPKE